ncbi:hypothetical protein MRX96_023942 [Rhipicephalus microplus]
MSAGTAKLLRTRLINNKEAVSYRETSLRFGLRSGESLADEEDDESLQCFLFDFAFDDEALVPSDTFDLFFPAEVLFFFEDFLTLVEPVLDFLEPPLFATGLRYDFFLLFFVLVCFAGGGESYEADDSLSPSSSSSEDDRE